MDIGKEGVRVQGFRNNDTAVSPVIGVMLMITVTIIIAATLSAYVGGSTGEMKKSPQATLVVRSGGEGDDFNILFEHQGGDSLRTEDLEIVSWVKGEDKTVTKHVQNAGSAFATIDSQTVRVPYVYNSQTGITPAVSFGPAVWRAGTVAGTGNRQATAAFLGMSEADLDDLIASNTMAEIDIVYRPGGNVLSKADIVLEE